MAAKKKRTPAQIAATKKLIAYNKRRRRKNPAPKKKRATPRAKKTTARKVSRRVVLENVFFVVTKSGNSYKYYDGEKFVTQKNDAAFFTSERVAKRIAQSIADVDSRTIGVLIDAKK